MTSSFTGVAPQDAALNAFRTLFPFPSRKVTVSEGGWKMSISVTDDRLAARWLLAAQHLISANQLPLEADIEEFRLQGLVFDRHLIIQFIPSLTPLECY